MNKFPTGVISIFVRAIVLQPDSPTQPILAVFSPTKR